jgi:uncharacterized protein YciI
MRKYVVVFSQLGNFEVTVEAEDFEDAEQKAKASPEVARAVMSRMIRQFTAAYCTSILPE